MCTRFLVFRAFFRVVQIWRCATNLVTYSNTKTWHMSLGLFICNTFVKCNTPNKSADGKISMGNIFFSTVFSQNTRILSWMRVVPFLKMHLTSALAISRVFYAIYLRICYVFEKLCPVFWGRSWFFVIILLMNPRTNNMVFNFSIMVSIIFQRLVGHRDGSYSDGNRLWMVVFTTKLTSKW